MGTGLLEKKVATAVRRGGSLEGGGFWIKRGGAEIASCLVKW